MENNKSKNAIGCVVYPACEILEPGVIKHTKGDRFSLGEPNGLNTERLKIISNLMIESGLKAPQKRSLETKFGLNYWATVLLIL